MLSPRLLYLLLRIGQFAHVMGIALNVQAVQLEIRFPVFENQNAGKVGQHILGFHRFHAALKHYIGKSLKRDCQRNPH